MRLYQKYRIADEGAPLVIEGIMLEIAGGGFAASSAART
jgi:hypothetical protein